MITIDGEAPIFVVDDSPSDRHIIECIVGRSRLQNPVELFDSGEAVLERLEAVADGRAPAPGLILLDVNMPGVGGFDVLTAVRGRPEFGQRPAVSILSSSDADEDRARAEALGAIYLEKPSGISQFVELFDATFTNA